MLLARVSLWIRNPGEPFSGDGGERLVISKEDMMGVLLVVCPEFAPQWEAFQDEWREKANDLPLYLVLANFARHLIGMLERGETAGLHTVFAAVERLQVEGEHNVREAVTIGLLEGLQNLNLHPNGTDPKQFRLYLGPESAREWDKLYQFWQHGELLSDD